LAKGGGAFADVHRHVKHSAAHHANQLALGLWQLEVQATQHALGASAVVVLHKIHIQAGDLVEVLLVEAFKKEASAVAEHFGLKGQQVGDVCFGDGVGHISEARCCRSRLGASFRSLDRRKKRPK
jgi:hypothetical protein